MLDYEKKLKYFDYLENGAKKRTAGFVKIERKGEYCDIQVSVTGVGGTSSLNREIRLEFGTREETLGNLSIREGKGNLILKHLNREKLCGTSENSSSYEALTGIRIFMGKEKELYCAWREAVTETSPKGKAEEAAEKENVEEKFIAGKNEVEKNAEGKDIVEKNRVEGNAIEKHIAGKNEVEKNTEEKNIVEKNRVEGNAIEKYIAGKNIKEDIASKDIIAEYKAAEECKSRQVFYINSMEAEPKQEAREMQEEGGKEGKKPEDMRQEQVKDERQEEREQEQEAKTESVQEVKEKQEHKKQMPEAKEENGIDQKISLQKNGMDNRGRKNGLACSKWQQLWYLYPHRIPFHDEREYLSVRPEDFVILNSRSYKLVNNSFLLHGFFNYDYLLLGRMEKDGKERFYIGVPGNFYEREKQVALMFGFESFECQKEPAQVGDFGYYMIPVEL